MHRWKVALARSKPNSYTTLAIQPGMLPGTICSPTSKDTTIVSGYIPPSGISPPNRQSAKPLDPVSTKSGEGQLGPYQYLFTSPNSLAIPVAPSGVSERKAIVGAEDWEGPGFQTRMNAAAVVNAFPETCAGRLCRSGITVKSRPQEC